MVVKLGGRGPGHKSRTPPGTTTAAMTLSGLSTPENSAAGALIGTLGTVGTTGTPVYALDNSAGSKAAISGANINRGATALSYTTATFFDITVSVTGVTPTISPTTFRIAVTPTTVIPGLFGMPDASNTGVQSGITLTAYTGPQIIFTSGTLVENKIINSSTGYDGIALGAGADSVTFRNCLIGFGIWGVEGSEATNITVEHCDIIGPGALGSSNSGIGGQGIFRYNHIRDVAIGIQLRSGSTTITNNYIHDLSRAGEDPHYDGIALFGGQSSVLIEHNTIMMPTVGGTSSLLLENINGGISDLTFRDNLCSGEPSYTITADNGFGATAITNILIQQNYLQRGAFGYFNTGTAGVTASGNIQWQGGVDPIPYP